MRIKGRLTEKIIFNLIVAVSMHARNVTAFESLKLYILLLL